MAPRRVVIAGGGTGGHFYPGLVLAQTLRSRGWQSVTLVRKEDPALPILEREGLAAVEVDVIGLPRRPSPALLAFPWKLVKGFGLISRVLKDFRPDAVVGMGGYLTFPAILAAARRGIARAVHESNAVLGLANRASLPLGAKLFLGLPMQRGTLTGTPIRPALWEPLPPEPARRDLGLDPRTPTVLVFGGSQGARVLNERAPAALAEAARRAPFQVLHLAGLKDAPAVEAVYAANGLRAVVLPYLEAMEKAYAAADLAICRSGASTLAELAAQGKPAILVPFGAAAGGHQELNARFLEEKGSARVLRQEDLGRDLAVLTAGALAPSALESMRRAYTALGLPKAADCAARLADEVEKLSRPPASPPSPP